MKMKAAHRSLWDTVEVLLRGKLMALNINIKKEDPRPVLQASILRSQTQKSKLNPVRTEPRRQEKQRSVKQKTLEEISATRTGISLHPA